MQTKGLGPLIPELVNQLVIDAGGEQATTKVFCIDGVIVEIPLRQALVRLPYDVMHMDRTMGFVISSQGKEAQFLTPMTSEMILIDVPNGKVVENINKNSVNMVAAIHGANPVFGEDQDGVLR